MIEVYGGPGCSRCVMVKNMLSSKGIEFEYKSLESADPSILRKAGEAGLLEVPIVIGEDGNAINFRDLLKAR